MSQNQEKYQKLETNSSAEEHHVTQSTATPVLPSAPTVKARDKHKNVLFCLGITECLMGGLSLVFAIATLSIDKGTYSRGNVHHALTYTSQGLWAGIFILVTGILGICVKKNPSVSMYRANMVLSILTAIFAPIGVVVSGFATAVSFPLTSLVTLHILITLMLFGGFIISIVHSAFCCAGLCGQRNYPSTVVYIPQVHTSQQIGGIPNVPHVVSGGAPSMQHHYNAQSMQPGVYHQVQVAVPPQTVYTNQGISPNAQHSDAQSVPHV